MVPIAAAAEPGGGPVTRLDDVAVVIPTRHASRPETLAHIPDEVAEVTVQRADGRGKARNIGAAQTEAPVLVFIDDDVAFERPVLEDLAARVRDRGTVVGLEDYGLGYCISRLLAIHRHDFHRIGGWDERLNHMEDTELCIRAADRGLTVETVPRDRVDHEDHPSPGQGRLATLRGLARIVRRHPGTAPAVVRGVVG